MSKTPKAPRASATSGEVVLQLPAVPAPTKDVLYNPTDFGRCEKCLQHQNEEHKCEEVEIVRPLQLNGVIYAPGKQFLPSDSFHAWRNCVK